MNARCMVGVEEEYVRIELLENTGAEHQKREMEVSIWAYKLAGRLYDGLENNDMAPAFFEKRLSSLIQAYAAE
ncbi:MAG: hypothetical protein IJ234_09665 [Clostridia bacterium]|nr:hypothetical protein [Clostridia bacterium]